MDWCKLWAEWRTDPKVQIMPEHMRCRHVMLLALRCEHETERLSDEEMAFAMRIDMEALEETKELFIAKGFINSKWKVLKWEQRQSSASPDAKRMRALRERRRNALRNGDERVQEQMPNAFASRPREEIRLEERREEKNPPTPRRGKPSATATDCVLPSWLPEKSLADWLEHRKSIGHPVKPGNLPAVIRKLTRFRDAGHDPLEVLENAVVGGYQGLFAPTDSNIPRRNGTAKPAIPEISDEEMARRKEERRIYQAKLEKQMAESIAAAKAREANAPPIPEPIREASRPPAAKLTQNELLAQIERMKKGDA